MNNLVEKEVRVKFTDGPLKHGFLVTLEYRCGPDVEQFFDEKGEITAVGTTLEEAYSNLNKKYNDIRDRAEKNGFKLKTVLVEDLSTFGNALKIKIS